MHFRAFACLLVLLGMCTGSSHAHFSVDMSDRHQSRYGPGEIKSAPCGRPDGDRGKHVYTYAPGETVQLSWVEYVGHPGYYRIAFDNDGRTTSRIPPASSRPDAPAPRASATAVRATSTTTRPC